MQKRRQILHVGVLGVMLAVSGCNVTAPSQVNVNKIQVRDKAFTETLSADHVDKAEVTAVARQIMRKGNSDVTLLVPYTDGGKANALNIGAAYKKAFAAQGVKHFYVDVVEMKMGEDAQKAVLTYKGVVAAVPKGCGRIPGYQGDAMMEDADEYKFGCETQANLSKMIADPSDLLGRAPASEADSQRNGIIVDTYMQGKPNQQLKGMSASSIGN